jgi:hypothetical protein
MLYCSLETYESLLDNMAKAKGSAKAKANSKTLEKSKEPMTPSAARKDVLGRIGKPYKKAVSQLLLQYSIYLMALESKEQKKFFKDFLARLEERDKKLEQSDLKVSSAF